jgi:hypothetical protein
MAVLIDSDTEISYYAGEWIDGSSGWNSIRVKRYFRRNCSRLINPRELAAKGVKIIYELNVTIQSQPQSVSLFFILRRDCFIYLF